MFYRRQIAMTFNLWCSCFKQSGSSWQTANDTFYNIFFVIIQITRNYVILMLISLGLNQFADLEFSKIVLLYTKYVFGYFEKKLEV